MTTKLTKRVIDAAMPADRDLYVFDKDVKGFGIKITRRGAKIYFADYRVGGGRGAKKERFTIGRHGSPWTPDAARREAIRVLRVVKELGVSPAAERKLDRSRTSIAAANTVRAVVDDFTERYLKRKAPRRWRESRRVLEYDVVSRWGDRPVSHITSSDVAGLLENILSRPSRRRDASGQNVIGCPSLANHVHKGLSTLFKWCVRPTIGYLTESPMNGIEKPAAEIERDRVLTDAELAAVWRATAELGFPFGPAVRLMIATAQRRDEVGGMMWSELDIPGRRWVIPAERSKNGRPNIVPLTDLAIAALHEIPSRAVEGCDYVFTTNGTSPASGYSRAKRRLDTLMSGLCQQSLENWTFHDLRRTVATNLAQMGVAQHVIERLLNHLPRQLRGVARIYNRYEYLEERRTALMAWDSRIREIVGFGFRGQICPQ